jgi:hypothetical protein
MIEVISMIYPIDYLDFHGFTYPKIQKTLLLNIYAYIRITA